MTIPLRSKKYSYAKGVVADTDVGVNSPRTENNNNVNISLSLTKDSCKNIEVNTVIDNLYIYFNNMKVYKVVVAINPSMKKKAKRLGLLSDYVTTYFDDVPITIEGEYTNKNNLSINKGKYIVIYSPNSGKATVYPGEETEQEQLSNLYN